MSAALLTDVGCGSFCHGWSLAAEFGSGGQLGERSPKKAETASAPNGRDSGMASPWRDAVDASIQGVLPGYWEPRGPSTSVGMTEAGMAAPWPDAMVAQVHLNVSTSDPCFLGQAARGVLGDGGNPGGCLRADTGVRPYHGTAQVMHLPLPVSKRDWCARL